MARVEIYEVVTYPIGPTTVRKFVLDHPVPLTQSDTYAFEIEGWIIGLTSPVAIQVLHGSCIIRQAPVCVRRPDVVADHTEMLIPEKCGFWTPVSTLGLPHEFDLRLEVLWDDSTHHTVALLKGRHRPLVSDYVAEFQPLMIYTPGRTGSTWLIHHLIEHPQIVARRIYPYETRTGEYWMQVLKVLTDPSGPHDEFESQEWAGVVGRPMHYLGAPLRSLIPDRGIELNRWLGSTHVEHIANVCQRSVDGYYKQVAIHQGKVEALFFVEKFFEVNYLSRIMSTLYPKCREIFLIRDFRDMFCSMLAFSSRNRSSTFGRGCEDSDDDFLQTLQRRIMSLIGEWETRASRSLLVRYEDFVTDPGTTLGVVCEYLDLDASAAIIDEISSRALATKRTLAGHQTISDANATVGRWQHDLNRELIDSCERAFGELLARFGYQSR